MVKNSIINGLMKVFIRILFIIAFLELILLSCSKTREKKERGNIPLDSSEVQVEKEEIKIQSLDEKELLKEIGVIKEFNPEIFVKLTILYRRESKKWLEESRSLPPEDQRNYMEGANRSFFTRFGTTEEDYISYSQSHIDELNAYMDEHPELLKDVMED